MKIIVRFLSCFLAVVILICSLLGCVQDPSQPQESTVGTQPESQTDAGEWMNRDWPIDQDIIDDNLHEEYLTGYEVKYDSIGNIYHLGIDNTCIYSHRGWDNYEQSREKVQEYYSKIQRRILWNSYIEHVALGTVDPEATKLDLRTVKSIMINSDMNSDQMEDFWKRLMTYRVYADTFYGDNVWVRHINEEGDDVYGPLPGKYLEFWFDYTGLEYIVVDCHALTVTYYDHGEKTLLYNREDGILWD